MTAGRRADLALAAVALVGAVPALLLPGVPWPIEWVFGVPLLVALPGYAVVAALFPERPGSTSRVDRGPPGWVVRAALSVVLSTVVVATVGIPLAAVGALALAPALVGVVGVSLACLWVAAVRRRTVAPERRADPLSAASGAPVRDLLGTSKLGAVGLVGATLVLAVALSVAGATPGVDDPYSEVYVPADADGALAGEGTPTLVAGADNEVTFALSNHEGRSAEYEVVLRLERLDADGEVVARERLDRFETTLADGETETYERAVAPETTGDRLRLRVLVYEGDAEPGVDLPDLTLRQFVAVTEASA